jgi:hypothetical protein
MVISLRASSAARPRKWQHQHVGFFFGQQPHQHTVTYFIARGGKFSLGKLPSTMC